MFSAEAKQTMSDHLTVCEDAKVSWISPVSSDSEYMCTGNLFLAINLTHMCWDMSSTITVEEALCAKSLLVQSWYSRLAADTH